MMKKWVITIFFLALFGLTSCSEALSLGESPQESKEKLYETYVVGIANDGIVSMLEKQWWTGMSFQNSDVQKVRDFEINGILYECQYDSTRHDPLDPYPQHVYECREGLVVTDIYVDSVTGEFAGFFKRPHQNAFLKMNEIENSDEYAEDIAYKLAGQYIDVSQYVVTTKSESLVLISEDGSEGEVVFYRYWFTKQIAGYKTADCFRVTVTNRGVLGFAWNNLGMFDDIDFTDFDPEGLKPSLQAKVDSIYSEYYDTYEYEITEQYITYSPEGDLVVVSFLSVVLNDNIETLIRVASVIG